jgi:hypothetical protein
MMSGGLTSREAGGSAESGEHGWDGMGLIYCFYKQCSHVFDALDVIDAPLRMDQHSDASPLCHMAQLRKEVNDCNRP